MKFISCNSFSKDLKSIQKKCKNINLENEIKKHILNLVVQQNIDNLKPVLFKSNDVIILKTRLKSCSGKGKSGGLRLIWGYIYKREYVILIKVYSKSEIENIPLDELIEEFKKCLRELML
ncbi:MAG: hypothetical protein WHT47_02260 [Hydrogenothermaceae bacterium]